MDLVERGKGTFWFLCPAWEGVVAGISMISTTVMILLRATKKKTTANLGRYDVG